MFGFASRSLFASLIGTVLVLAATASFAGGNDGLGRDPLASPFANPHTQELDLAFKARKRERRRVSVEPQDFLDATPGLAPFEWPRNTDMRARLLTPGLRRTPFVGWIAENLYRSKRENGWCLEVDPGEGEYAVFYRLHLR